MQLHIGKVLFPERRWRVTESTHRCIGYTCLRRKCFLEIGTEVVLNVGVGVGLSCVCVCVCAFFGLVGSCWCQEEILLLVHDGIMATDMQNHKAIVSSPGPSALNSHFFSHYPRGHVSQQLVTCRWLHARIHNGLLVH